MAKKKISGLPAGSALNGTELVPIVQTGTTKRITTQDIANLGNSSGVEGSGTINRVAKFTASSTIGNSQIFDNGTNVGIGTNNPTQKLSVDGNIDLFSSGGTSRFIVTNEVNTGTGRLVVQAGAGSASFGGALNLYANAHATNPGSVVIGLSQNANSKFRINNSALDTGADLMTVNYNGATTFSADATINGVTVGRGGGSIAENTAIGANALLSNTTGNYNTANGRNALYSNTTGSVNTANGRSALFYNTTGSDNTANGVNALYSNTTGSSNTANGSSALFYNTTGSGNTALGTASLFSNTTSNNTAVGYEAATNNTSGSVTAIGYRALKANTTGGANNALGDSALILNTTGSYNIGLGTEALSDNTTGSINIGIGLAVKSNNYSNNIIIGTLAEATASNQFVVGSASYPAGAVATESLTSDRSWAVRINGTAYKILLKA